MKWIVRHLGSYTCVVNSASQASCFGIGVDIDADAMAVAESLNAQAKGRAEI